MEFILGCNYWASNAGADMWRKYDLNIIREDIKTLSSYGVTHIRVFPNWRDFQPVMPQFAGKGILNSYCLEGDVAPDNPYYLDRCMLKRFQEFLGVCEEFGIKLIVGLITGWMSGRLYVPSALYEKNVLTDPTALYFEQLFIRGFVSEFKSSPAILAWDLGNECNCMAEATRLQALNWTATIANAIRAEDPTRMIISGMHGLEVNPGNPWLIKDQAMWNDVLTTHPYPYWCAYTRNDEILSLRTTMHATAQNKYYAECGNKPCLAEELGTMGPMLASNDAAAKFLRVNLFSLWANGALGVMWWCGHDQTLLSDFPYSENMVEVELGLLTIDRNPKPVLEEIKRFSGVLKTLDFKLPEAKTDAVCILTHGQRPWGVCYASHILSRQAGYNLRFCYADDGIPESDVYLMPSVNGITVMNSARFQELKKRVYEGAELYISLDNGVLSEFESLTGMRIIDSYEEHESKTFELGGDTFSFRTKRTYLMSSVGADILATDNQGNPLISVYQYGKGKVTCFNYPLEDNMIDCHDAFSSQNYKLYRKVLESKQKHQHVKVSGEGVFTTLHEDVENGRLYAVVINHTEKNAPILWESEKYTFSRVIYGCSAEVMPYDAAILEFVLK